MPHKISHIGRVGAQSAVDRSPVLRRGWQLQLTPGTRCSAVAGAQHRPALRRPRLLAVAPRTARTPRAPATDGSCRCRSTPAAVERHRRYCPPSASPTPKRYCHTSAPVSGLSACATTRILRHENQLSSPSWPASARREVVIRPHPRRATGTRPSVFADSTPIQL